MEKKGFSHIDWAISLGVFVIFLTTFFMIVRPMFNSGLDQSSMLNNVVKKFTDINEPNTVVWQVSRLPVYFNSTIEEKRALSSQLPYDWKTQNSSFTDRRKMLIDQQRIFFYQDMNKTEAWLVNSEHTYTQLSTTQKITCSTSKANTTNPDFSVGIENSELRNITYNGSIKAENIDIILSGADSYSSDTFICSYKKASHEFYVMANDSVIFNYFDTPGLIKMNMELADDEYRSYYIANPHHINYSTANCANKSAIDFLDFYNETGIAFMSDNFNATFCWKNESGSLKLNLSLIFTAPYTILVHNGNYSSALDYKKTQIIFGMLQKVEGISYDKLKKLNTSRANNYSGLKESWELSQNSNFDWKIDNKTIE
jgi:hypothetical protein